MDEVGFDLGEVFAHAGFGGFFPVCLLGDFGFAGFCQREFTDGLSYGFHFDVCGQKGEFFVAFWAVSVVLLEDFVWGFEVFAFIQNVAASLAFDALRHHQSLPSCLENSFVAYLLVAKFGCVCVFFLLVVVTFFRVHNNFFYFVLLGGFFVLVLFYCPFWLCKLSQAVLGGLVV